MGRPAKAREKIIAGVDTYVELHASDPETYPRTKEAYARYLGVSHGAVHQKHPAVEVALRRLTGDEEASEIPPVTSRPTVDELRSRVGGGDARGLTDRDLARHIEQAVQECVWAMSRFVQQRKREELVEHAPLILYDLDQALGQLHRHAETLRPLVEERQRRLRDSYDS